MENEATTREEIEAALQKKKKELWVNYPAIPKIAKIFTKGCSEMVSEAFQIHNARLFCHIRSAKVSEITKIAKSSKRHPEMVSKALRGVQWVSKGC